MNYLIFGLTMDSDFRLGIPAQKTAKRAHLKIRLGEVQKQTTPVRQMTIHRDTDHTLRMTIPNFGMFQMDVHKKTLALYPARKIAAEFIQSVILNQGIPFALSTMGEILVHASAIKTAKGAVVFMGRKGQGKSTMAAQAARAGLQVLADDLIRIDFKKGPMVYPSFPEIRLFPEDAKAHAPIARGTKESYLKRRLDIRDHYCGQPQRLHKILHLKKATRKGESVPYRVSPIKSAARFRWLMDNLILYPTFGEAPGDLGQWESIIRLCRLDKFERLVISHQSFRFKDMLSIISA